MADCSKTVDFLKERKRLCDSYKCKLCPIQKFFKIPDVCPLFDNDLCDEELIDYVQKWSDEHPEPKPKTYADDFFEKHPNAKRHENGRPIAYRCDVYGCECNYKKSPEVIYWRDKQGIDDCLTCWNEPYKEDEQ